MEQEHDTIEQDEESAQPDNPLLRVEKLSKTYQIPDGKLQVLHDVDLQVRWGEFITITGPSGSGKTTLLSLIGALDSPDSGEIWLEDTAVHRLRGTAAADFRREQVGCSNSFTCCRISQPWRM
jgi:ABC-type lipoprotein export system ATPase subunit